ncbi:hypothetical protein AB832_07545 [Flavobacteriaceae bacterium (ex Bugula neritina AB1)]|nr:hypothetical protein AB832_07545 [Flavobacteriaceae bacterium (ex Bugula neritina AB1)]
MKLKYKLNSSCKVVKYKPTYHTKGSVCFDLIYSDTWYQTKIEPNETKIISTGLSIDFEGKYYGLLYLRSSMAKKGFILANGVGVIDSDYKGEIKVCLTSTCHNNITLGDRIAQLMVLKVPERVELEQVENFDDNLNEERGSFGSTGK